jgi:hypothetical protein
LDRRIFEELPDPWNHLTPVEFDRRHPRFVGHSSDGVGQIEPTEKGFLSEVLSDYPDFEFKPDGVTVLIDTPGQAFAEYVSHATAAGTGRKVDLLFMGRIVVEDGQIKLLREALNTLAVAQALLPGGAADVPAPGNEVQSV